jgi:hypothetical protein
LCSRRITRCLGPNDDGRAGETQGTPILKLPAIGQEIMMSGHFQIRSLGRLTALAAALALALGGQQARAAIYLNEIFVDSPGSGDDDEYFEIRGASTDSLNNHYFIQLENEDTASNNPGVVDFVFNLSSYAFSGATDYLWFSQSGEDYSGAPDGTYSGNTLENSGGTFLIVNTTGAGTAPAAGDIWDTNIDGDFDTSADTNGAGDWNNSWSIVDSIGVFAEADDISGSGDGRLYADVNFAAGVFTGISTSGTSKALGGAPGSPANVNTNLSTLLGATPGGGTSAEDAYKFGEVEYVGRYGDTTSKTDSLAWIAANATDQIDFLNNIYEVSGNHSTLQDPEVVLGSNVDAPHSYGHDLTGTLGAANSTSLTPEPASMALAALGGLAIVNLARRRRA